MAKYQVNYSCGHSGEVQLFGKLSERERKLEWMSGRPCKECWHKQKLEEEAKRPITASVKSNGLHVTDDGALVCEVVLTGGTINKKEGIKALGYRWQGVAGGVMSMLSMSAPRRAWVKEVAVDVDDAEKSLAPVLEELNGIADKFKVSIGPLDLAMARKTILEKKEELKRIEALGPKPERPSCHPANIGGRWNGKYYGGKDNRSYYVDNIKYELSEYDYLECMRYRADIQAYNEKVALCKTN